MRPLDNEARREDLEWMASTGESAEGAAARMGLSYGALERWAHRHAREVWSVLVARNPRDHNYRSGNCNQWRAA